MRFDALGFQDIRIDRSLSQEFDPFQFGGFFGEDVDEFLPDDLPLLFRIVDTRELLQETVLRLC